MLLMCTLYAVRCTRDYRMIPRWNGKIGKPIGKEDENREENAICVDDAGAIVYDLVICVPYIDTRTTNIRWSGKWETQTFAW